ncbi:hypothetical protein [Campylobacter curvus]|uniref:hypothetical protein n=1 Tax=Campylobacter curvus TaxID=200 RepID=UPI00146FEA4E|nr:hypothetical protein [Campylobacter curvus]
MQNIRELTEFTQMIDAIIENYENIISKAEEVDKTKEEVARLIESTNTIKQIINSFDANKADFDAKFAGFDKLYNDVLSLKDALSKISGQTGIINDNNESIIQTYSSVKINALIQKITSSLTSFSQSLDVNTKNYEKTEKEITKIKEDIDKKPNAADVVRNDTYTQEKQTIDTALAKKANSDDVYSKPDVDTKFMLKKDAVDAYSKSEADTKFEPKTNKETYKGIRLFDRLQSVAYLAFYQEVERRISDDEIVKYGDIYIQGIKNNDYMIPFTTNMNKTSNWIRLPFPFGEEIVDLIGDSGCYSATPIYAKVKDKSYIYTWGYNGHGQLGVGHTNAPVKMFKVNFPDKVKDIYVVGGNFSYTYAAVYVILENLDVYVCGANSYMQLGIGTSVDASTFIKNEALSGKDIVKITGKVGCGAAAILRSGRCLVWGQNTQGCLGLGDGAPKSTPLYLTDENIKDVYVQSHWYETGQGGSQAYSSVTILLSDATAKASGYLQKITNPARTANEINQFETVLDKDGQVLNNLKKIYIGACYWGFALKNSGEFYISGDSNNCYTFKEAKNEATKGFTKLMDNVKDIHLIMSPRVDYVILFIETIDNEWYALMKCGGPKGFPFDFLKSTYANSSTVPDYPKDLDNCIMTLPFKPLQIVKYYRNDNTSGDIWMTDGKSIYTSGSIGSGSTYQVAGGFTKVNLMQGERI